MAATQPHPATLPPWRRPPCSRRRSLLGRPLDDGGDGAVAAKPLPDWLEASESYCHDAQYYLGQHSGCFDALRAYYAHDVSLFGLPRCDDPPA